MSRRLTIVPRPGGKDRRPRPGGMGVGVIVGVLAVALPTTACGAGAGDTTTPRATTTAPQATGATGPTEAPPSVGDACAHVVGVDVRRDSDGYTFSVTVSSTEAGWDKYADLWVVKGPDGAVLGERVLAHPHVDEQPFTRSQRGIEIPTEVGEVTVAARDSVLGFCGDELTVMVPAEGA